MKDVVNGKGRVPEDGLPMGVIDEDWLRPGCKLGRFDLLRIHTDKGHGRGLATDADARAGLETTNANDTCLVHSLELSFRYQATTVSPETVNAKIRWPVERLSTKSGAGGGRTSPDVPPPQPAPATTADAAKQLQTRPNSVHSVIPTLRSPITPLRSELAQ